MPLKSYIELDPQVRKIVLFSQACFALAVTILAMSFAQWILQINKSISPNELSNNYIQLYVHTNPTESGTHDLKIEKSKKNSELDNLDNTDEDHLTPEIIRSLHLTISLLLCSIVSFGIGIVGAYSTDLMKNIKIADIAKRMDEDFEDYLRQKKEKEKQNRIVETQNHINYGVDRIKDIIKND